MTISTRFPTANEVSHVLPQWTNPSNAQADDAVDATATAISTDVANNWKTFGFDADIPAGATINAVKVIVEFGITDGGGALGPSLFTNTVVGGVDQIQRVAAASGVYPTVATVDHTADRAWTRADLLDANFKVRVYAQGDTPTNDYQLDYVKVEVTYTAAGATTDLPRRVTQPGAPMRTTAEQPRPRMNAVIAAVVAVTRPGSPPPETQWWPSAPSIGAAAQPLHREAPWMQQVIVATRPTPAPAEIQWWPQPPTIGAGVQPLVRVATYANEISRLTPAGIFEVVPRIIAPPITAPQPITDAALIADQGQPAVTTIVPHGPVPATPALRVTAAQPIEPSWLATIIGDVPPPARAQPTPTIIATAAQPIGPAWTATVASDYAGAPRAQPTATVIRSAPQPIATAALIETQQNVIAPARPQPTPAPATSGTQPASEAAWLADVARAGLERIPSPVSQPPAPLAIAAAQPLVHIATAAVVLTLERIPGALAACTSYVVQVVAQLPSRMAALIADQGQPAAPATFVPRTLPPETPSAVTTARQPASDSAAIAVRSDFAFTRTGTTLAITLTPAAQPPVRIAWFGEARELAMSWRAWPQLPAPIAPTGRQPMSDAAVLAIEVVPAARVLASIATTATATQPEDLAGALIADQGQPAVVVLGRRPRPVEIRAAAAPQPRPLSAAIFAGRTTAGIVRFSIDVMTKLLAFLSRTAPNTNVKVSADSAINLRVSSSSNTNIVVTSASAYRVGWSMDEEED